MGLGIKSAHIKNAAPLNQSKNSERCEGPLMVGIVTVVVAPGLDAQSIEEGIERSV